MIATGTHATLFGPQHALPWSQVPELRYGRRSPLWSCRRRTT
jgi:hypothetical protein